MVSKLRTITLSLTNAWISFSIFTFTGLLFAQEEIEEPAGDLESAIGNSYDGDDYEAGEAFQGDPTNMESDGADSGLDASATADTENDQIGPVWDSYSDNMKSVAQEVTRGLRVEDVVEPPTEYHYSAFGKPDPFVPPILARESTATQAVSGLEVPIVSPLQRYDIHALKLVGIWQLRSGERKALILTPGGGQGSSDAGIIVRNGDSVGNRAGKILTIGDAFLTVREFKLAVDGTRQYEDVQMLMGSKDPSTVGGKIRFTPGKSDTEVIIDGESISGPVVGGPQDGGLNPPGNNQPFGTQIGQNFSLSNQGTSLARPLPNGANAPANVVKTPEEKPHQMVGDPHATGIAPLAGGKLPDSINGMALPIEPSATKIESP